MIGTIVHQLTRNLTQEQLREGGRTWPLSRRPV